MLLLPPALQAPAPSTPAKPAHPVAATPKAKLDLPPDFKPAFRYVVRPWERVNYGSLGPREKAVRTWELENRSDRPITFKVADLSPGVVVVGDPFKEPIPPHAKRAFSIQVDTTDWEGYQRRGIRLVSDDPTQPAYKVLFDMTIRPDLAVDSVQQKLAGVAPYESPQAVFHFKRETGDPLELKLASDLPPYLDAEVVPMGSAADLRVTLRAPKIPAGQLEGLEALKVTTNAPHQPSFDLYLTWSLKLPVKPVPSRVVFADPQSTSLELKLEGARPFRILSAKLEAEGFAVDPLPKGEARIQTLTVRRLRPDAKDGLLVLTFSGVEDPLQVPVIWADPARK